MTKKKSALVEFLHRADAFCARINDGLTVVAIVLALVTTAALLQRLPTLGLTSDPVSDASFGDR